MVRSASKRIAGVDDAGNIKTPPPSYYDSLNQSQNETAENAGCNTPPPTYRQSNENYEAPPKNNYIARPNHADSDATPDGLSINQPVRLTNLRANTDLNGEAGIIIEDVNSAGKFLVQMRDNEVIRIHAKNLELMEEEKEEESEEKEEEPFRSGDDVCLRHLAVDGDLNGQRGVIIDDADENGKYLVQLERNDEVIRIHTKNLELRNFFSGYHVRLRNLAVNGNLNGQLGMVVGPADEKGKLFVQLDRTDEVIQIHPRNLNRYIPKACI